MVAGSSKHALDLISADSGGNANAAQICASVVKITLVFASHRIDIGLPIQAILAEIMPTVIQLANRESSPPVADSLNGWSLQKFGESPLNPGMKIADLPIRNGDVLYLRPWADPFPEIVFDDLPDAIAQTKKYSKTWQLPHSLNLLSLAMPLVLLIPAGYLAWHLLHRSFSEADRPIFWLVTLVLTGLAVIISVVKSRTNPSNLLVKLMGSAAVVLSSISGWAYPFVPYWWRIALPTALLCGLAVSVFCFLQVKGCKTIFACISQTIVLLLATATFAAATGHYFETAATASFFLLVATFLLPKFCYRFFQIYQPPIRMLADCVTSESGEFIFRSKVSQIPDSSLPKIKAAEKLLSICLTSSATAFCFLAAILALDTSWLSPTFGLAISMSLLLRCREYHSINQRLPLIIAGYISTVMFVTRLVSLLPSQSLGLLFLAAGSIVSLAIMLVCYTSADIDQLPARIGQTVDLLDWIFLITVIPLLAGRLGIYQLIASLTHMF